MHIVNVSPLVDTIINFVRPFLKEKIRQRIHFHSNLDSLYKFVPQKMLPKEYGGEAGTMEELTGKFILWHFNWDLLQQNANPNSFLMQNNGAQNSVNTPHGSRSKKIRKPTKHCDLAHQRLPTIYSAWTVPSVNWPLIRRKTTNTAATSLFFLMD